jgi:hypothetical protein
VSRDPLGIAAARWGPYAVAAVLLLMVAGASTPTPSLT